MLSLGEYWRYRYIILCWCCIIRKFQDVIKTWWLHQMETFSVLLTICAGNSPVTAEFPAQRPVAQSFDVFFDLRLNKRLSKQSWGWWFEMPSRPLWRHCNEPSIRYIMPDVNYASQCRPMNRRSFSQNRHQLTAKIFRAKSFSAMHISRQCCLSIYLLEWAVTKFTTQYNCMMMRTVTMVIMTMMMTIIKITIIV